MAERLFEPSSPANFPTRPAAAHEDLRKRMAERGIRDHYFFCKAILGYDALTPRAHGALCKFLLKVRFNRRMILMPRTHFKTTIVTIGNNIRRAVADPNIRILLIADTGANAERFMEEIKNHFERNQLLQWLYPEVIPDSFNKTRWNNQELELKRSAIWREPTFDAIGAGGGVESRHYDVINPDDLVTEKHIHSDTEMDKLINWIGGIEPLLVHDRKQVDFVGSRKKKGDAYEHIEKYYGAQENPEKPIGPHAVRKGGIVVFSRSITENGKRIFPERVSWSYIIRMRTKDPARYHAQLANSPKGTGLNTFRLEDLRFYRRKGSIIECWHDGVLLHTASIFGMERIGLYDPSVAEKKTSSQNALGIIGKGNHPFRFLLSTAIGHYPPDEAIDKLLAMDKEYQPQFWSIERRAYQGSVKYWLAERCEMEGRYAPVVIEWPLEGAGNSQWAKTEHIRGLQPMIRNNLLWVDESMAEVIDQVEFYPNVRWDDGLDMLSQSLDYWPMLEDDSGADSRRMSERRRLSEETGISEDQVNTWNELEYLQRFDSTGYGVKR